MAIRVIPTFNPGQVDHFDPSQTVGQFNKGAEDSVALGRHMMNRATEAIALEKLRYLAPIAKEQAKQNLYKQMMDDTEHMDAAAQANRRAGIAKGNYELGVNLDGTPTDAGQASAGGAMNPVTKSVSDGLLQSSGSAPGSVNSDVRGIAESPNGGFIPAPGYSDDGTPLNESLNNLQELRAPSGNISASQIPSAPAPSNDISKAIQIAAAGPAPMESNVPLNPGYNWSPSRYNALHEKARAEKLSDALALASGKEKSKFHASQYMTITDGTNFDTILRGVEPIPDGWKPYEKPLANSGSGAASIKNTEMRTIEKRMEANEKTVAGAMKILQNADAAPDAQKQATIDIAESKAENDVLRMGGTPEEVAKARKAASDAASKKFDEILESVEKPKEGNSIFDSMKRVITLKPRLTKKLPAPTAERPATGQVKAPAGRVLMQNVETGRIGHLPESQVQAAIDSGQYTLAK